MISKFEYISEDIKVKDFVAIDFETAKALDPCQVGIAVVRNCQIVQTCTYLIRPIDNLYHHKTIEVHHITPKMTENEMSFPDVWSKIVDIFDNEYIVAHNAKFDISVLKYTLDYYGLEYPNIKGYICTCILNNHESLKLACARYRIDLLNHHDGGDDAINCAKLYIAHH